MKLVIANSILRGIHNLLGQLIQMGYEFDEVNNAEIYSWNLGFIEITARINMNSI